MRLVWHWINHTKYSIHNFGSLCIICWLFPNFIKFSFLKVVFNCLKCLTGLARQVMSQIFQKTDSCRTMTRSIAKPNCKIWRCRTTFGQKSNSVEGIHLWNFDSWRAYDRFLAPKLKWWLKPWKISNVIPKSSQCSNCVPSEVIVYMGTGTVCRRPLGWGRTTSLSYKPSHLVALTWAKLINLVHQHRSWKLCVMRR